MAKPTQKQVNSAIAKAKFASDYKSGKMTVNAGEVISPAKIGAKVAFKIAEAAANTKVGVKVAETVAKKVAAQSMTKGKKAVEVVAKAQEKTKAEKIASNSVKVEPKNSAAQRARVNNDSNLRARMVKSGNAAGGDAALKDIALTKARSAGYKPNVVKIKSGK